MRGLGIEFIILMVLVLGGGGAAVYALFFTDAAKNRRKMLARMKQLGQRNVKSGKADAGETNLRRDDDRTALDKLARRILPNPKILMRRLEATGKNITIGKYLVMSVVVAVVAAVAAWIFAPVPAGVTPLIGLAAGVMIPHKLVNRWGLKRSAEFTDQLPEALDLIGRGVKSGLPVAETISSVSEEMDAPISVEMGRVIQDMRAGMTLETALWLAAERVNSPEFKFFVVTLSVSRETGGNLAETLEGLSEMVRGRRQMKKKVKAVASEANASKYILGGLPVAIGLVLFIIANEYIMILFNTEGGNKLLAVGTVLMTIGWKVMDKMANFDI